MVDGNCIGATQQQFHVEGKPSKVSRNHGIERKRFGFAPVSRVVMSPQQEKHNG